MPTLRDVARHAGLSLGSVSSALTGRRRVSREVRQRTWAAVRELGYQWRPHRPTTPEAVRLTIFSPAASLEALQSDPFYGDIAEALVTRLADEQRAIQIGYRSFHEAMQPGLRPGADRSSRPRCRPAVRSVAVLLGLQPSPQVRTWCRHLAARGRTIVVDEDLGYPAVDAVLTDDLGAMRAAIRHLAARGHRRFALVRGPQQFSSFRARWIGFEEALKETGLPRNHAWVVEAPPTVEGGRTAGQCLLHDRPHGFSAVLTANDAQAVGLMEAFKSEGVRIPTDASIVGFDDVEFATTEGLSTIKVPCRLMGELAAFLVLRAAADLHGSARGPGQVIRVTPTLVERATTADGPRRAARRPRAPLPDFVARR